MLALTGQQGIERLPETSFGNGIRSFGLQTLKSLHFEAKTWVIALCISYLIALLRQLGPIYANHYGDNFCRVLNDLDKLGKKLPPLVLRRCSTLIQQP